jgi:hypothetical protein
MRLVPDESGVNDPGREPHGCDQVNISFHSAAGHTEPILQRQRRNSYFSLKGVRWK